MAWKMPRVKRESIPSYFNCSNYYYRTEAIFFKNQIFSILQKDVGSEKLPAKRWERKLHFSEAERRKCWPKKLMEAKIARKLQSETVEAKSRKRMFYQPASPVLGSWDIFEGDRLIFYTFFVRYFDTLSGKK